MNYTFDKCTPQIDERAWVAKSADVIGRVTLARDASIFFHSVVRGDGGNITIGEGTNIQDNCTLHCDPGFHLTIGKDVTVGHNCILHGCHIEDKCLIGMGAIVMDGAHIESHCLIGAGALIGEGMHIPKGSVVVGLPGKIIKNCSEEQILLIQENAKHYRELSKTYKEED